jgi:two-component system sensor histidine kinase UhpB
VLDAVDLPVVVFDLQGTITYWSRAAERRYGWPATQVIGQPAAGIIPMVETLLNRGEIKEQLRQGRSVTGEVQGRRLDGTVVPAEMRASPLHDHEGASIGIVATLSDVAGRTRIGMALQDRQHQLDEAQHLAHLGSWEWDIATDEVTWSEEIWRIFGLEPQQFPATWSLILERIHPDDRERVRQIHLQAQEDHKPFEYEARVRLPAGTVRIVRSRGTVSGAGSGQAKRMIGIAQDITEFKQTEAALRASEARLQALTQRLVDSQENERMRVAHELLDQVGQALTAIHMNLEMLGGSPDPAAQARYQAEAARIVQQTLQQVRALSIDLRPALLDDLGLVSTLRWYVEREAQRAGYEGYLEVRHIYTRLPSKVETACFRIVQEALSNIERHAHAQRAVVELRRDDDDLWLVIRDDGDGFDVEAAWARSSAGACLGLVAMQERAELIGGTLVVEAAPGEGTSVRAHFSLPRAF